MNNRGEVVFCLIGETCLTWIFLTTVVVCGEILIKDSLEIFIIPCYPLVVNLFLSYFPYHLSRFSYLKILHIH
jgi:hypothetical protein